MCGASTWANTSECDALCLDFGHESRSVKPSLSLRMSQHLADAAPVSQINGYTWLHPWTQERTLAIQSTIKEIRQKQAAKKPLVP